MVVSTDGAVSGRRASCAAEIGAFALAGDRASGLLEPGGMVTFEVDNPSVPGVIEGSHRPPGFARIPKDALEIAHVFVEPIRSSFRFGLEGRRQACPGQTA